MRNADVLVDLFDRKYGVLVLAELARSGGAKVVTLGHRTGASRGAVRVTLDDLTERGWVERNPGYGHPMRPEYRLTRSGASIARRCRALNELLESQGLRDLATRKWALPVLAAVGKKPARFSEIAGRLPGVTDRALSLALQDLTQADLVRRDLRDERPPTAVYSATPAGRRLLPRLGRLA